MSAFEVGEGCFTFSNEQCLVIKLYIGYKTSLHILPFIQ